MADNTSIITEQPGQDLPASNPLAKGVVQRDEAYLHLMQPDAVDAAGANWRLNTLVGQSYNLFSHQGEDGVPDPSFNPYAYLRENQKQYEDIAPLVANGSLWFDNFVDNRSKFDAYVEAQRKNIKDRRTVAQADGWGQVLSFGSSMLDVTSLMSLGTAAFGAAGARTILGRAAIGGAIFGTDATAQELALHTVDDTRTAEESFMNIGTSVALGAALGPVFKYARPNNPLNAGHPNNPLHPDNFDHIEINEHRIGELPEEGSKVGARDSVGAMRASDPGDEIAVGESKVAKAMDWLASTRFTPLGRLNGYSNPLVKDTLLSMYDTGGLLTKAMAEGRARAPEAETIKTLMDQRASAIREDVASIYRQANMDLGQSAGETAAKGAVHTATLGWKDTNTIPQSTFNEAVSLIHQGSNAGARNELISQAVMKKLTDAGLSPEQAKLAHQRVYQAEKVYHEAYESLWDEAVRVGLADPKTAGEGRYGMPQLWDRNAIDANPEGFKAFMQQHMGTTPTDDWLRENHYIRGKDEVPDAEDPINHTSWEDIKKSGDDTQINSILKVWRGEEQHFNNEYLAGQLAEAERRQLGAQETAADILTDFKKSDTNWRHAKLSEMRAAGRTQERDTMLRSVASAALKANKAEEKVKGILARMPDVEGMAGDLAESLRLNGYNLDDAGARVAAAKPVKSEADSLVSALRGEKGEVIGDMKDVKATLGGIEQPRAMTPLRQDRARVHQELRDAVNEQKAAKAELQSANAEFDALARQQADTRRWYDAAVKEINALKANEADALLAPGYRSTLFNEMDRLSALKGELEKATAGRRSAYDVRRKLGQDARGAAKESNRAAHNLRKTAFRARKYTSNTSPLTKYIDELADNLRGNDRAPRGLLLDASKESGRLKERQFKFDFDEYRHLTDNGFLKANSDDSFMSYHQDLGGQIAAHRGLGGRKIEEILKEVQDDYDARIGSLQDPKERTQLNAERNSALEDVKAAHDRILGRYDTKDHNGVVWTADRLKMMGIVRYMGGFIFSAVGDIATAAFSAPGSVLKILAFRGSRDVSYILKQAKAGDSDMKELAMIFGSMETGLHMNMSDKALGRGAAREHVGFGTGLTRDISTKIEKGMDLMADMGNKFSGLKSFSDNIRRTAGLVQLGNVRNWTKAFSTLDAGKRAQLAALGIGEREAGRLTELFEKYGTEQRHGLFSPGMTKWLKEKDGEEMKYVLETALLKAQKRASYTSGYGNQPLLMDKWYGKLFLQFQSMAFQFQNNFVRAGFQHGAVTGDHVRFAAALGWALSAGVVMNAIATFRKGEAMEDQLQNPHQFAYNVVQRSGLLGYLGSYVDAGVKLSDPVLKANLGFTLGGGASKYSQNSWLGNLMGPWGSNVETLQSLGANAVNGEFDKVGEKALRLAPLNQQMALLQRIVSTIQE